MENKHAEPCFLRFTRGTPYFYLRKNFEEMEKKTMFKMMSNEQYHTPITALGTGLDSLRSNQQDSWNLSVDYKPENSLFAIIVLKLRKLYHNIFSGSFCSYFKWSAHAGTGTRWARTV